VFSQAKIPNKIADCRIPIVDFQIANQKPKISNSDDPDLGEAVEILK
jgi:hypothetical protein